MHARRGTLFPYVRSHLPVGESSEQDDAVGPAPLGLLIYVAVDVSRRGTIL